MRKQSRPQSAFLCLRKLFTVAPKQLYLVPEKNEKRRSHGGTRDFKPDGDDQRIMVGLKFLLGKCGKYFFPGGLI